MTTNAMQILEARQAKKQYYLLRNTAIKEGLDLIDERYPESVTIKELSEVTGLAPSFWGLCFGRPTILYRPVWQKFIREYPNYNISNYWLVCINKKRYYREMDKDGNPLEHILVKREKVSAIAYCQAAINKRENKEND